MKRTLFALAATLLLLSAAAQAKVVDNLGIAIQSCVVNNNNGQTNGINVVYYSSHSVPVKSVTFLVGYHGKRYMLTDNGTFTHGAQINHNLTNALVGQVWSGPNVNLCTPQKIILADGTVETR